MGTNSNKTNKRYRYILQEYKKDQVDPLFLTHVDDYNVGNPRSLKDWFKFTDIIEKKKVEDHCSKKYNKFMNRWK